MRRSLRGRASRHVSRQVKSGGAGWLGSIGVVGVGWSVCCWI